MTETLEQIVERLARETWDRPCGLRQSINISLRAAILAGQQQERRGCELLAELEGYYDLSAAIRRRGEERKSDE